jgi:hypothetical protein
MTAPTAAVADKAAVADQPAPLTLRYVLGCAANRGRRRDAHVAANDYPDARAAVIDGIPFHSATRPLATFSRSCLER